MHVAVEGDIMSLNSAQDYQQLLKSSRRRLNDIKREDKWTLSNLLLIINEDIFPLTRPQLFFINDLLNKVRKSDDEIRFCSLLPKKVKKMARAVVVAPIESGSSIEEALLESRQEEIGQIQFDIYPNNEIVIPSSGPCKVLKRPEYDKD
jgi:hypothetical protein